MPAKALIVCGFKLFYLLKYKCDCTRFLKVFNTYKKSTYENSGILAEKNFYPSAFFTR